MGRGGLGANPRKRRMAAAKAKVPAGLIILLNNAVVPSGWTRVSDADDRMIIGAGGSYAVQETGGSWTSTTQVTSSTTGTHIAHAQHGGRGPSGGAKPETNIYGGDHSHDVGVTYAPDRQRCLLIKSDADHMVFPDHAVLLGDGAVGALATIFNDDHYLYGGSVVEQVAESIAGDISVAGAHWHPVADTSAGGSGLSTHIVNGDHSTEHGITGLSVTPSLKSVLLRALDCANENLQAGLIALWDGVDIPTGWAELDLMRDYFIKINAAGDASLAGTNELTLGGGLDSYSWTHHHMGSNVSDLYHYNANKTVPHSHTVSGNVDYVPPYYALTIIKYIG